MSTIFLSLLLDKYGEDSMAISSSSMKD